MHTRKGWCTDCEKPTTHHFFTWCEDILTPVLPQRELPYWYEQLLYRLLESTVHLFRLARYTEHYSRNEITPRMWYFFETLKGYGITPMLLETRFGITPLWKIHVGKKTLRGSQLPCTPLHKKHILSTVNNKQRTKRFLEKHGFPVAQGSSFFVFNRKRIHTYVDRIGFPVVVKPRNGTFSRHVTTHITNHEELDEAIKKVRHYSPTCIVETYLEHMSVYRITVINAQDVFCAKQERASIEGDGVHTINELVTKKSLRRRAHPVLEPLILNKKSDEVLQKQNLTRKSIPKATERVYIQEDPFLRLGGDITEVTDTLHPDNRKLAIDIALSSGMSIVGIDLMTQDIRKSWKESTAAILELNEMPCIEIHKYPSEGTPTNPAESIIRNILTQFS